MKAHDRRKAGAARGVVAFDEYYSSIWKDRWPSLREALLGEAASAEWAHGLLRPYALDPASILAALALGRARGESCLDLCAAPGGKALVIASRMEDSRLTANERSDDRFMRMKRVLELHLKADILSRVEAKKSNGASLCRRLPASFDRIILDAPCSSERHVIISPAHAAIWSPARARALPFEQWALLSSAFIMLKPGGRLVYSTCALNPAENEGVAERLVKKEGEAVEILDAREEIFREIADVPGETREALRGAMEAAESRSPGIIIMPDAGTKPEGKASGPGPMYIAVFRKRA
jgi:16S rRNA C967 or C1407 C5-methylase (RsmB/RsmF family)